MRQPVLFVCIGNSGRSQMAEGFARAAGIDAHSCGTRPADEVNPLVIEAMKEKGIDLAGNHPKGFEQVPRAQTVVTMGCGDACPYVPGNRLDWGLPDPKGMGIDDIRKVRDEIERRVAELARQLLA